MDSARPQRRTMTWIRKQSYLAHTCRHHHLSPSETGRCHYNSALRYLLSRTKIGGDLRKCRFFRFRGLHLEGEERWELWSSEHFLCLCRRRGRMRPSQPADLFHMFPGEKGERLPIHRTTLKKKREKRQRQLAGVGFQGSFARVQRKLTFTTSSHSSFLWLHVCWTILHC